MAAAGGQTVQLPEPVTREEMFLKKIAENGGNKPFNIVELMPETQFVYDESAGYFTAQTDFELVIGRTYIINWNGVEYTCTARYVSFNAMPVISVGNDAIVGGEDNGVPFGLARILLMPDAKGFIGAIPMDGSTEISVSIKGVESSALYDTSNTLVLDTRVDSSTGKLAIIYATPDEILNAFMMGRKLAIVGMTSGTSHGLNVLCQMDVVYVTTGAEYITLYDILLRTGFEFKYNGDGTYVPYSD